MFPLIGALTAGLSLSLYTGVHHALHDPDVKINRKTRSHPFMFDETGATDWIHMHKDWSRWNRPGVDVGNVTIFGPWSMPEARPGLADQYGPSPPKDARPIGVQEPPQGLPSQRIA